MSPAARPSIALYKVSGLSSDRTVMTARHITPSFYSHNNVALNFLERGRIRTLMATGVRYELKAGRLAVFWGAVPHRTEEFDSGTIGHSVVLPLGAFLHWAMPDSFVRQLIGGQVFIEAGDEEAVLDLMLFNRWHKEIARADAEGGKIVMLEIEARLRRLARSCRSPRRIPRIVPHGPNSQAERMLLLIAEHFREPLSAADVAAAVGVHPDYAGRVFRQHLGIGLTDYITECRISHAKSLLATTDKKMLDVAMDSGFGAISHFHAVFKRLCGCTPRIYRTNLRGGSD